MFFKISKKHLLLFGIDSLTFIGVYLFSIIVDVLSDSTQGIEDLFKTISSFALNFLVFYVMIFAARYLAKVYRNIWRYADSAIYLELISADIIGGIIAFVLTMLIPPIRFSGWHSIATVAMFNCECAVKRINHR